MRYIEAHEDCVRDAKYSFDNSLIVSCSNDKTIKIWDENSDKKPWKTLKGHDDDITSVHFSKDGKKVLSSSYDKTIKLWDIETEK